ncbi:MAG: hypothetical protein GY925_01190 [Actinomycetia bacterium]|nr:hypothetical protein [Actinomycetes bacterium]
MPQDPMPPDDTDPLAEVVYTIIGFAVLGFQRAQVRRRRLRSELSSIARSWARHSAERQADEPA